jgi:predicted metal-dependent hydrolase
MTESRLGIIDLLGEPASFGAEVTVHELLHLKIPNHGRHFKALLKARLAELG